MSTARDVLAELQRQAAKVRAARFHPRPKLVRMHPLDAAALTKLEPNLLDGGLQRVLEIPLELDCAVRRGQPEIDYE